MWHVGALAILQMESIQTPMKRMVGAVNGLGFSAAFIAVMCVALKWAELANSVVHPVGNDAQLTATFWRRLRIGLIAVCGLAFPALLFWAFLATDDNQIAAASISFATCAYVIAFIFAMCGMKLYIEMRDVHTTLASQGDVQLHLSILKKLTLWGLFYCVVRGSVFVAFPLVRASSPLGQVIVFIINDLVDGIGLYGLARQFRIRLSGHKRSVSTGRPFGSSAGGTYSRFQ